VIPTNYKAPEAVTETETRLLSMSDRCDRCGAQAFVRVTFRNGGGLDFCGHHYADHEAALIPITLNIVDERKWINEKGGAST